MAADDKKQQQMKQQIASYLRKKDYYDILGIQKDSNQAQIKKAYKKLALRFHPDKNNTQGSKQVFKKVSNAYSNLIDSQKRASYDRYGPQEDRAPQYRPQRHYRQGYSQQDEFQQIFRAFFGGAMPRGGHHYQNNHFQHFTFNMGGMGGARQQQQQQNGSSFSLIYLLVIIFIIYILPILIPKQQPLYSTTPSSNYKFAMKTSLFQAPYYVRQQYYTQNKNGKYTKTIQQAVDTQYYMKVKKQCDVQLWTTRQTGGKKKYGSSCTKFYNMQEEYSDYIRDLFYGY